MSFPMAIFRGKVRGEGKIFGWIVKTIERGLEEYDLSDLYRLVREKEKRLVHVNYAGGWLLAPFIADMVNKTRQAYDGLPGSVEAILTLFFLPKTL